MQKFIKTKFLIYDKMQTINYIDKKVYSVILNIEEGAINHGQMQ